MNEEQIEFFKAKNWDFFTLPPDLNPTDAAF